MPFLPAFTDRPHPRLASSQWLVPGYGLVVVFSQSEVQVCHVAGQRRWNERDKQSYQTDYLKLVSFDGGRVRFAGSEEGTHYFATPLNRLPAMAGVTPESTFDAFWETMDAHYAFFKERGIDWKQRRSLRRRLLGATTDDALFDTLAKALEGIEDAHLGLSATIGGTERRVALGRGKIGSLLREALAGQTAFTDVNSFGRDWVGRDRAAVHALLLPNSRGSALGERLCWGKIDGVTGYLELTAMGGFAESTDGDLKDLAPALDRALESLKSTKRLILDLAQNRGGDDRVARLLASRFTDRKRLAYSKRAFRRPESESQSFFIEPSKVGYAGRVFLLTSNVTVSAGEVAATCLQGIPNVQHFGETTRGALSDRLTLTLPNGWELSLSNEIYKDSRGICSEGKGIAPVVALPLFPSNQLFSGHKRAVQALASRTVE